VPPAGGVEGVAAGGIAGGAVGAVSGGAFGISGTAPPPAAFSPAASADGRSVTRNRPKADAPRNAERAACAADSGVVTWTPRASSNCVGVNTTR
jgi:hypothetical protein